LVFIHSFPASFIPSDDIRLSFAYFVTPDNKRQAYTKKWGQMVSHSAEVSSAGRALLGEKAGRDGTAPQRAL
jgi:hypothetical protein